jgi:uncharacterized protein (TIGR00255 family)
MTGYGRASCELGGRRFIVELRSVNHRFLEVKMRLPFAEAGLEARIVQQFRARLDRGMVQATIRDEGGSSPLEVRADLPLARAYAGELAKVRAAIHSEEAISLELIAAQPGVLTVGDPFPDPETLFSGLRPGLDEALEALVQARTREGAALRDDLLARVVILRRIADEIDRLAADLPMLARKRLRSRLERLLGSAESVELAQPAPPIQMDPQRLAQEVALLAEKTDVSEELTRLRTHLIELDRLLGETGPVGRRLEFLSQELLREFNTIGSKAQSADVASRIVGAKAELERLREQIQNVE